jgi:periplasmic divalent cation tolerance protein
MAVRSPKTSFIQVMTTAGRKSDAEKIARRLLKDRLAACVQIVGPVSSTYWWQGALESAKEWLCLAKTQKTKYKEVERAIRAIHPYSVPEILAVAVAAGDPDYLKWLNQEMKTAKKG